MPRVRKGTYVFCTIKKLCVENMAVSCGLGKHYNIKCPPPLVNPYDVLTNYSTYHIVPSKEFCKSYG